MAQYKYREFLNHSNNTVYDEVFNAGAASPYSGIYRCQKCGHEITHVSGRVLPPQNHHTHTVAQGEIVWQLTVAHGYVQ